MAESSICRLAGLDHCPQEFGPVWRQCQQAGDDGDVEARDGKHVTIQLLDADGEPAGWPTDVEDPLRQAGDWVPQRST